MGLLDGLRSDSARVGIFVDGPNVFRAEFDVDLDELRAIAREEGSVAVAPGTQGRSDALRNAANDEITLG